MTHYKRFICNPLQENTYIIWDDCTHDAAIVDCGAYSTAERTDISDFIQTETLHPVLALQTHMHFDHIFGLGWLKETYGLRPICHAAEQENYDMQDVMASEMFGVTMTLARPAVERYVADGDLLQLGDSTLTVIHTPGHSAGGVCYLTEDFLLSGDTLFAGSCGRTDLPGGNMNDEAHSIKHKILTLQPHITVLPGHGPETSIARERRYWM